jgi:hypothetical protein
VKTRGERDTSAAASQHRLPWRRSARGEVEGKRGVRERWRWRVGGAGAEMGRGGERV